ncbi:MAG: glycoside hydrolase family 30 beta sandwich domain-containing protein [Bacteroidota bacterium]|nr:glycoside hydrolase family 30 beta sandwich domain-containing protein [Bacteroidota bacterium]
MKATLKHRLLFIFFVTISFSCDKSLENGPDTNEPQTTFEFWLSNPDKSAMFQQQNTSKPLTATNPQLIEINETQTFQTIDGFGCALTGGSAQLINQMSADAKSALLKELFAFDGTNIGMSYLRISIGASDLDDHVFSYNDLPAGQTDTAMANFTLDPDRTHLIPILKQILAINPDIKILGSPWSAPLWMKTNNGSIGGSLKLQYYRAYAKYFVKYIQEMKNEGIRIDAITVQNEPLHGGNNPSMVMQAADQALFIKNYLGPVFAANNIDTKIIIYDHNADRTDYPITVLNDPDAKKYIDGSAFHLYGGTIEMLSTVHNAHPDKHLYFTEQWIGAPGNYPSDLSWHIKTLFIGGTLNWCRNVLEWNLAADPNQNPHTDGGCSECLGVVTINGNVVVRNPAYYIIAHASKFIRPGSVRIGSTGSANLPNVVFKTTDGKKVALILNNGQTAQAFKIKDGEKEIVSFLNAGAVGTYIW